MRFAVITRGEVQERCGCLVGNVARLITHVGSASGDYCPAPGGLGTRPTEMEEIVRV